MRSIRTRLSLALVALVAVSVLVIGVGTYAFVESRLRDGLLTVAERQSQFNLSVLVPERLPGGVTREALEDDALADAFRLRGDVETIVDFADGELPYVSSLTLLGSVDTLPASLRTLVADGHLGYAWLAVAAEPSLVIGGRPQAGPDFYFVFSAGAIEAALEQLRLGLAAAAVLAVALALAAAGVISRGILRPVALGSAAAARMAAGDLSARLPAGGADEFARWADQFNRMADSLAATVSRLEASETQNRRFVADVSHELRTPVTALVAEASLIEAELDRMPDDTRRAAQLLVADVRRLRILVDDLMELSRFDARAELADLEPIELGPAIRAIVESRLPTATVVVDPEPIVVEADRRRLDRIVGNVLDNARDHAPGSAVSVRVERRGGEALVTVEDDGPGVPPEALSHLFDRFFKVDSSRSQGSSGLGLAIAAEHAALLGGSVAAENRDATGLAVMLRLPVTASLPAGDRDDTRPGESVALRDAAQVPGASARHTA